MTALQAITDSIRHRYGWEKVEITDNELYFDFPSGTLNGCDKRGDDWLMLVPENSVTVVYAFESTCKTPYEGFPRKPVELVGDQSHTYHFRGNMLLVSEQGNSFLVAGSSKITVSRSPFRIRLHDLAKQAPAADHKIILFRYLLIKPLP